MILECKREDVKTHYKLSLWELFFRIIVTRMRDLICNNVINIQNLVIFKRENREDEFNFLHIKNI